MSTGISISSINRIKELAEEKKFKEALEILDTQNLDKSINPQFLKISGEIFRENKRYYDSRRILLKAHQMAPQGIRIMHELIQLYLELGYFSKAQKYYEQYMFYTTPDDTQKEYVEYIMKKATGADIKELAAILIPILERMPEDRWNFEAILLYHKMDRKDMALEESRYILENFKESPYVQPVIDYIDDKLDVDEWFYTYPKEEQPEDEELYGDLLELEEKILDADYLMMYPPEARIMVEADDNDAPEVTPAKEKKPKKRFGKNAKKQPSDTDVEKNAETVSEPTSEVSDVNASKDKDGDDAEHTTVDSEQATEAKEEVKAESTDEAKVESQAESTDEMKAESQEDTKDEAKAEGVSNDEELIQKEREEALEKILSKKFDKDKLKESAKQVAQAVKDIDTDKAKKQMRNVADTVKDNMKKASNVFNEAVGTTQAAAMLHVASEQASTSDEDEILDGIIESVLEPPKKVVGEVVMNEELDALIPDSLEAMSEQEIADIEAKKEELERLELEALEATLKLEEEKKAKKLAKSKSNLEEDTTEESSEEDIESDSIDESQVDSENEVSEESEQESKDVPEGVSYAELKSRFLENEEEKPLDSLGFISVVHSDVDEAMEDAVPDAAGMLRQMIDNKEYYSGESSLGFESKASYENHGFEVEDYDFDMYRIQTEETVEDDSLESVSEDATQDVTQEEISPVQEIFTKESVVAFEDVVSEDEAQLESSQEYVEETVTEEPLIYEEPVVAEEPVTYEESVVAEETVAYEESVEEPVVYEEPVLEEESVTYEEPVVEEEPVAYEEPVVAEESVTYEEPVVAEEPVTYEEPVNYEEPVIYENVSAFVEIMDSRTKIREDIVLSDTMEMMLRKLKEGR